MIFESAIICATVGLMCPAMSFIAAFLYYPYYAGFTIFTLLAEWLKLVCFNLPFAFFTQLFFIQPFVRTLFKVLFSKDIKAREQIATSAQESGHAIKPGDEMDAITEIMRRVKQIQTELQRENHAN
jgi:hypothetical protein